ncbi:hypothetical protein [Chrysiogenes arsenatis]|uniref:hypothetical protein n=1 Tax=Chrysiogenes arsenatis TaxID=309797 RepID=UPI00040A7025|nr:hypothetical protein [Chrysiogenes arsenatis]
MENFPPILILKGKTQKIREPIFPACKDAAFSVYSDITDENTETRASFLHLFSLRFPPATQHLSHIAYILSLRFWVNSW